MKIRPVAAESFPCKRTDGQDEANSRLSQFCEAPTNPSHSLAFKSLFIFYPQTRTVSPAKLVSCCWQMNEYGELVE